jgi:hypothetical protein
MAATVEKGIITRVNGFSAKLIVPAVSGNAESAWATPLGKGFLSPVVGDQVWVAYDHGDVTKPLYFPTSQPSHRAYNLVAESISTTPISFSTTAPTDTGLAVSWSSVETRRYIIDYYVNFIYASSVGTNLWARALVYDNAGTGFPYAGLGSGYILTLQANASTAARGNDSYLEVAATHTKTAKVAMNVPTGQSATLSATGGFLRIWEVGQ